MSADEDDKVQRRAAELSTQTAATARKELEEDDASVAEDAACKAFLAEFVDRLEVNLARLTSSKADLQLTGFWHGAYVGFYFQKLSTGLGPSRRCVVTVYASDAVDDERLLDVHIDRSQSSEHDEVAYDLSLDAAVKLATDEVVEAMAECVSTGARIVSPEEARKHQERCDKAIARGIFFDNLLNGVVLAACYLTLSRLVVANHFLPADHWLVWPGKIFWRWLFSLG